MMRKTPILVLILLVSSLILAACGGSETPTQLPATHTPAASLADPVVTIVNPTLEEAKATLVQDPVAEPISEPQAEPTALPTEKPPAISQFFKGLDTPWEIAFLPNGSLLTTERPGTLSLLDDSGKKIQIEGVREISEGGLLGLALDPEFETNQWLYLYLTSDTSGRLMNRVERYTYHEDHSISDRLVILEGIRGSANHDGGRIRFGPDGLLYITTGDAGMPDAAQDPNLLEGKILRIKADGSIPADNPWGNAVYSIGHRNPQGLAWDSQGRLWSTEHGPSGGETGNDELNLIEPGKNYGWPLIRGMETREGMQTPKLESGRGNTWAPSGLEIVDDWAYFPGLRGNALYAVPLDDPRHESLKEYFKAEYGRLRAILLGPDGLLYLGTSNKDGRGNPAADDDQLLKIDLSQLP